MIFPPEAEAEQREDDRRSGTLAGAVFARITAARSQARPTAEQWRAGSALLLAAIFGAWMLWGWWR